MFIYNITIKVENTIHREWLEWMQQTHIPHILGSGKFTHHRLLRLRDIEEQEGPTYALQLFAESKALYNAFITLHLPEMQQLQMARWGTKMLSFSTLMEIVH